MGKYDELHTCHNECERPACVLRRKVAALEAELAAMKARGDRLAEALDASGYAVNSAAMEVDAEWRGYGLKADKYREIVTEFRDQRRQALTEWRDQHHGGNDAD